jgi:hypothetical protein
MWCMILSESIVLERVGALENETSLLDEGMKLEEKEVILKDESWI